jgi:hypothetical protein
MDLRFHLFFAAVATVLAVSVARAAEPDMSGEVGLILEPAPDYMVLIFTPETRVCYVDVAQWDADTDARGFSILLPGGKGANPLTGEPVEVITLMSTDGRAAETWGVVPGEDIICLHAVTLHQPAV